MNNYLLCNDSKLDTRCLSVSYREFCRFMTHC